ARVLTLQGTEHPYIALVERINEGAVTLSRDGVILYCNGCFARFLRIPRERVLGSPFREAVAPDDREVFDAMFTRGTEGGSRSEIALLSADGARHQVLLSLSPLAPVLEPGQAPERGRTGVIGIVTDLDDLKAAEQRLEARVRQQAAIAELGQRALADISLDAVLEDATHLVARTLGAARCEVAELLPDGERLRIRAVTGAPAGRRDGIIPAAEDSLSWLALRSGEPVVVDDVATDPRFADRPLPAGDGIVSAIAVVVPHDGAPFGVLAAASPSPHRFSGDDTHFLQAAANVLAAAIIRRRSEDLRRWLLEELTKSRDGERRRLSRELHDETRQSLWALVVGLDALETVAELEHARDAAHRLHAIAARTLDDIGRLARGLHPGALDDHGLVAAATQYLHDFTSSYGIPVEQGVENLEKRRLPPEVEITLYRILQEALTNVARHARARSVRVMLRRRAAAVELTVADDGIGFRVEPVRSPMRPGGLGLHGMRERASMLGGEVTVASQPGGGTTVTTRIPLQAAADQ
ncbi:MAG: GAF domain-containing protein, partial [Gemmatimonadales bacterium]|nr:GAF domain-containing protein [Gemmatimonadales bacterium]